ncbi:hypothetical protein F990_01195 [Acinetobacter tjernbergiae DSM 14971 = CIP 107465]|uniref:Uncharacterized protein n=1 Tax=Acinetobacter tjernbergiae DSM 14971 = CIP 107465 TaxID=1120928 RepID=V2V1P1_9GAMM|nr:hypothetical protein F990_01195 [Acinetobacter tjernbergiae DSM 14971 = CIP 107465]
MLALALLSSYFPLLTHAETSKTLPVIEQQKQVAGYYQHQAGDVQITALLDGTSFMPPTFLKIYQRASVSNIKKYYVNQNKSI